MRCKLELVPSPFQSFSYVGPEDIRDASRASPKGTVLSSLQDCLRWIERNPLERERGWLTYIVDSQLSLRVAPRRSEHVACAGGSQVLGAGELRLSEAGEVLEISNLSTGYCPDPCCWEAVRAALQRAGLSHPPRFTFAVDFRRCEVCGQRNVVKERWLVCSACDAALPEAWNFGADPR